MDKQALTRDVIAQLNAELALQTDAANNAREEATNEESRAEDKYDMRSQSAAYLAAGQARLAGEIADAIAAWQAVPVRAFGPGEEIAAGALVTLEAGGLRDRYFVGPHSGGLEARAGEATAVVVTSTSPLGRQLVGRRVGDQVILTGRATLVTHRVVAVD